MKFFGLELTRKGAEVTGEAVPRSRWGWLGGALESFQGAWQRGIVVDTVEATVAFSAVFSCVSLIAADVSKLRIKLMQQSAAGIWSEATSSAFSPVLRKPNRYQTRIQFLSAWVVSLLLHGNTYVLKERDGRGVVVALHVLNPMLVQVLVTEDGGVYYRLNRDPLSGLEFATTIPSSEIIHDRDNCLFHPLCGVAPIFACAAAATQGNRIQANSAKFFENMSRPSGMITGPDLIPDETAERLKRDFEKNFSGANIGRLLVMGDGLKYEAMTIPAQQAQLIEQQRWTVEDVARCFRVPLHKIGASTNVKFSNMAEMNQDYYSQTLQVRIESIELLLDEGLGLAAGGVQDLGVELDLEGLLRMDPVQRAERNEKAMKAGYMAPDEARATESLPPLPEGAGKVPFLQQQNFPITVLAKQPPPGSMPPAPVAPTPAAPAPVDPAADTGKALADAVRAQIEHADAVRAARDTAAADAHLAVIREMADAARAERTALETVVAKAVADAADSVAAAVAAMRGAIPAEPEPVDDAKEVEVLKEFASLLIARFAEAEHAG